MRRAQVVLEARCDVSLEQRFQARDTGRAHSAGSSKPAGAARSAARSAPDQMRCERNR
jgi:hypothetical protein